MFSACTFINRSTEMGVQVLGFEWRRPAVRPRDRALGSADGYESEDGGRVALRPWLTAAGSTCPCPGLHLLAFIICFLDGTRWPWLCFLPAEHSIVHEAQHPETLTCITSDLQCPFWWEVTGSRQLTGTSPPALTLCGDSLPLTWGRGHQPSY